MACVNCGIGVHCAVGRSGFSWHDMQRTMDHVHAAGEWVIPGFKSGKFHHCALVAGQTCVNAQIGEDNMRCAFACFLAVECDGCGEAFLQFDDGRGVAALHSDIDALMAILHMGDASRSLPEEIPNDNDAEHYRCRDDDGTHLASVPVSLVPCRLGSPGVFCCGMCREGRECESLGV